MNYRHAFHAGNHADVLKHAVLSRILAYLNAKPKPYRVIDTHAGTGLYDLGAEEAVRSPEWREGIARIVAAAPPPDVARLLAPYLSAVTAANHGIDPREKLLHYPGSPFLARHLMRPDDRLTGVELHPADHALLAETFARDRRVKVIRLDGWLALGAQVPPKERRGIVLVDPPFEEARDWTRLVTGLVKAHARWPTGLYLLWYPIKRDAPVEALHAGLAAAGIARMLAAELVVRDPGASGLAGSGLVIVNAPYTLAGELERLLPWLADTLGGPSASHRLMVLAADRASR